MTTTRTLRACRTCLRPFRPVGKARYCSTACRCGTDAGYNAGCKCVPCKNAHSRNHNRLRMATNPRVSSVGTVRRLQALACLGWSMAELSRQLGMDRSYFHKIHRHTTLEPATAAAVASLFERLSMTWCTTTTAARTAADARRRGWAPPLAWDEDAIDNPNAKPLGQSSRGPQTVDGVDEATVDRILAGEHRLPSTRDERAEVARRWVHSGRSLADLGRATGWKPERYFRLTDTPQAA